MSSLLIAAQRVYAPGIPDAQAVLIDDGVIAWIGDKATAARFSNDVTGFVDAGESFIAPGFVDAHVHLSATGAGLANAGLAHLVSFADLARALNSAAVSPDDSAIILHGWDDTSWPDSIADFAHLLSAKILVRDFYLSRIDGHSAIVNGFGLPYAQPQLISGELRERIWAQISATEGAASLRTSIQTALRFAASNGIVAVHENGGPTVSSKADFAEVMSFAGQAHFPEISGYWGDSDISTAIALGAQGAAGDFSIDGSLGSHTALLSAAYTDAPALFGNEYLSPQAIAEHIVACTHNQLQAGFHAIGDQACENLYQGFLLALRKCTPTEIRARRHRLEHVEMPSRASLELYAQLGVILSVQPSFDAHWGGDSGMYAQRLGGTRAGQLNRFKDYLDAGVILAFGSDSPVTPIKPWQWLRAAINHRTSGQSLGTRAAFAASTRGGWRAGGDDNAGVIKVGAPAHLALWEVESYESTAVNGNANTWSTDPRSGTHPLPDLSFADPVCVATLKFGQAIYDRDGLFAGG